MKSVRELSRCASVGAVIGLVAVLLPLCPVAAAAPTRTPVGATKVDNVTCATWIAELRQVAQDPREAALVHAYISDSSIANLTSSDCSIGPAVTTVTTPKVSTARTLAAAAATSGVLKEYWQHICISFAGKCLNQWNANVGIVWYSPTSWTSSYKVDSRAWGPDCNLTGVPGFFGGYDQGGWCGVYNPQTANTAMPGSNFYFSPIPVPFAKKWGWMRYYAYASGSKSSPWGGWS